jgi:hypothetical protein
VLFEQHPADFGGVKKNFVANFYERDASVFLPVAQPPQTWTTFFRPNRIEQSDGILQLRLILILHFVSDAVRLIAFSRVRNATMSSFDV